MPSSRQAIHAPGAPKPNGDYSHAVKASNGTLYLAGWMGDDPETGEIVEGGIEAQTVCFGPMSLRVAAQSWMTRGEGGQKADSAMFD